MGGDDKAAMQKHILPILGVTLALGIGIFLAVWLYTPKAITAKLETSIRESGFRHITLPQPEQKFGKLTYSKIALDDDNFSRLNSVEITYGPFSLFSMRPAQKIKINGLDLTGELSENLDITIAGYSISPDTNGLEPLTKIAHQIEIENAKLSLLSDKLGGISLSGDIQILPKRAYTDIRGRISAAQKQLSIKTVINGRIHKKGDMTIESEIETAKFDFDDIRATRVAGNLRLDGRHLTTMSLLGELEAGSLNIHNQPWSNASITIDETLTSPRILIAAKSAGVEGLELSMTKHLNSEETGRMEIHAPDLQSAVSYLGVHNILKLDTATIQNLPNIEDIFVEIDQGTDNPKFALSAQNETVKINGNIIANEDNTKTIEFDSPPFDLEKLLPQSAAKASIRLSGPLTLTSENKIHGAPTLTLKNGQIPYGPLNITVPEAKFKLTSLENLNTSEDQTIPCHIKGLHNEIKCTLNAHIKNAKLAIKNLSLDGPGLDLEVSRAQKTNDKTLLFNLENLDIAETARLFGQEQWQGYGKLKGQILTRTDENGITVQNVSIQNDGAGILKITDPKFFNQIEAEDLEKETLKLAFENFHFETLNISGTGAFPDGIKIKMTGRGKNPDLMQGRTFSFDFDLTPNLLPVFSRLSE